MGFGKWFTGRDSKESADLYANYDKVNVVVDSLKSIETKEIENAKSEIQEAITKLNNVNGVAQYVGNVNPSSFDQIFDSIKSAIEEIAVRITSSAEDIKKYEESGFFKKAGSTFLMGASKFGEGALSVLEGIGDGFYSFVGWVAPKDSVVEKWAKENVEMNWSHDLMDLAYYEKDLSKSSRITEDSKAAGCFKIAGEATAYLYLGGALSGAAGAAGLGSTAVGQAGLQVASGSTWGATAVAAQAGLGKGSEVGLQQGKSMDEAFLTTGLKTAAIQGATAFAAGKIGEGLGKNSAVKAEKAKVTKAEEAFNTAKEEADDAAKNLLRAEDKFGQAAKNRANPDISEGYNANQFEEAFDAKVAAKAKADSAKEVLAKAESDLAGAKEGLEKVSNTKWTDYQGYTDKITKAGQDFGESTVKTGKAGLDAAKATKEAKSAARAVAKGKEGADDIVAMDLQAKAETAKDTFKQEAKSLLTENNPVAQTYNVGKNAVGKVTTGVKNTAETISNNGGIVQTAKNGLNSAKESISNVSLNGIKEGVKNAPSTIINGAKSGGASLIQGATRIATNPATPGVAGAYVNSIRGEVASANQNAASQFNSTANADISASNNTDWSVHNAKVQYEKDPTPPPGPSGGGTGTSGNGNNGDKGNKNNELVDTPEDLFNGDDTFIDNNTNDTTTIDNNNNVTPSDNTNTNVDTTQNTNTQTQTPSTTQPNTTPSETVVTKPSQPTTTTPTITTNTPSSQPSQTNQYTGGGYTGSGGYTPVTNNIETPEEEGLDDLIEETTTSIDDIVKGNNKSYNQIPKSSAPISRSKSSSGAGSTVIPIAAGLSAAAAAGIGAKAYIDRKNNNDNGEDEDLETEDWSESDTIDLSYDDSSDTDNENENILTEDDDYGYQSIEEEKYDARNSSELADMQ